MALIVKALLPFGHWRQENNSDWILQKAYMHKSHRRKVKLRRITHYVNSRKTASWRTSGVRDTSEPFSSHLGPKWAFDVGHSLLKNFQDGSSKILNQGLIMDGSGSQDVHGFDIAVKDIIESAVASPSLQIFSAILALIVGLKLFWQKYSSRDTSSAWETNSLVSALEAMEEELLLTMKPTQFNRFVVMRCPSISFENEEYGGLSDKLATKSSHFISLYSKEGLRLEKQEVIEWETGHDMNMKYQRTCLHADDGGTLAIDWPSHMDLGEEPGFDTTILLIPGTADGSGEQYIESFVHKSLRSGYFPIILNPRGTAGSPVTTARLFTAADSDDIKLVVNFLGESRPWTTLMAVGWGYGANMLIKYLGEEGHATPLTAVVCIDNPFDLEATKQGQGGSFDQKMTNGYVQILQSNKMIFEGKKKGFDIQKGLSAVSLREFDTAISKVAHGFDNLDEFYAYASTKLAIEKVKTPLLCVQSDIEGARIFSIPRHTFENNPFLMLLSPLKRSSSFNDNPIKSSTYGTLIVEWLAAVELALLKGRHPLLQGVDITIKPVKEVNVYGNQLPGAKDTYESENYRAGPNIGEVNKNLYQPTSKSDPFNSALKNGYKDIRPSKTDDTQDTGNEENGNDDKRSKVRQAIKSSSEVVDDTQDTGTEENESEDKRSKLRQIEQCPSEVVDDAQDTGNEENGSEDIEGEDKKSKVRQAAQSVMKVLDVTMPGTLPDEKKQHVLDAIERGDTVVSALQGAVPEDVRGKMAAAVSAAIESRGISFNLDGVRNSLPIPSLPDGTKDNIQEKLVTIAQGNFSQASSTNEGDQSGGNANAFLNDDKMSQNTEEKQGPVGSLDETKLDMNVSDTPKGVPTKVPGSNLNEAEKGTANEDISALEKSKSPESQQDKEIDSQNSDDEARQRSESEGNFTEAQQTKMANDPAAKTPEGQEKQGAEETSEKDTPNKESSEMNSTKAATSDQSLPLIPSSLDVHQAFQALTGFDDSTQMAVTNVFGVITNMIEKLEQEQDPKDPPARREVEKNNPPPDSKTPSESENENFNDKKLRPTEETGLTNMIKNLGQEQDQKDPTAYIELGKNNPPLDSKTSSSNGDVILNGEEFRPNDELGLCMNQEMILTPALPASSNRFLCEKDTEHLIPGSFSQVSRTKISRENGNKESLNGKNSLGKSPHDQGNDRVPNKWRGYKSAKGDTDVALEFCPKEKRWKFSDEGSAHLKSDCNVEATDQVVEPAYVILDDWTSPETSDVFLDLNDDHKNGMGSSEAIDNGGFIHSAEELPLTVKSIVMDALKFEVMRRLRTTVMESMELDVDKEIAKVADAVATVARNGGFSIQADGKVGVLDGDAIVNVVSSVVRGSSILGKLIPIGVLIGAILVSLGTIYLVVTNDDKEHKGPKDWDKSKAISPEAEAVESKVTTKSSKESQAEGRNPHENPVVGAVAAAMGVTVAAVSESSKDENASVSGTPGVGSQDSDMQSNISSDLDETELNEDQNIVTSLAEKAKSVAAPVVPTKEDGEVDHDRIVAILSSIGQKAIFLRFIGKAALLWGGLRGAMSLTDKLLVFLRISERPLHQRLASFVVMLLLLWSPVVVPLLPSLLQQLISHGHTGVAQHAAVIGLYGVIFILITIWGQRIRGYHQPLSCYGLRILSKSKFLVLCSGLGIGFTMVCILNMVNVSLGFTNINWIGYLSIVSPKSGLSHLAECLRLLKTVLQAFGTGISISLLEELVFRSWLQEEIATDLGFHKSILLSGLVFSCAHWITDRSPQAAPGLWLLSVVLAGVKSRMQGDLSLPIGIHAGLISGNLLINSGGLVKYTANAPRWFTGAQVSNPLSGVLGLLLVGIPALFLFPWKKTDDISRKEGQLEVQASHTVTG